MPELSQDTLLYGAGGLFALAILLFLVSLRLFRRSRRDVFWRRRREAGQRGWRLFLLAFTLLLISGATCASTLVISAMRGEEDVDGTPTVSDLAAGQLSVSPTAAEGDTLEAIAAITSTETLDPLLLTVPPVDSPAPQVEPSATPTGPPAILPTSQPPPPVTVVTVIATPGSTPTHTPFPTFTPHARPLASDVTPAPDARLEITALDDEVTNALLPVDPATSFPAGTERIYLFVAFENMTQGVLWRRELYRDEELIEGNSYLWGLPTEGRTSFFLGSDPAFAPGSYEIRLYLGDTSTPVSRMSFTIDTPDTE